jgi:F-type H+-transporting ATPase subunit gamma
MHTLETLKGRLKTTHDLHSVVTTMKALAAGNIRQCEQAVASLADYARAVEMGFQVVLRAGVSDVSQRPAPRRRLGAVVFGTDQGMCGPLNDQLVAHALPSLAADPKALILAVGHRVASRLQDAGLAPAETTPSPGSLAGLPVAVQDLLLTLDRWHAREGMDHVTLFYPRHLSGTSYPPSTVPLLPIDQGWLEALREKPWPTRILPACTGPPDGVFSALVRQHLFVGLYRAYAETLASENASRLAAMQTAERNIEERLGLLQSQFHQQRQDTITAELLDIVGGFEALTS